MKRTNIVFALALFTGSLLQAQQPLTIEQAIATSLGNNYDIRLSRNDSSLAALDDAFANYAFYPRLNANAGINFSLFYAKWGSAFIRELYDHSLALEQKFVILQQS